MLIQEYMSAVCGELFRFSISDFSDGHFYQKRALLDSKDFFLYTSDKYAFLTESYHFA